MRLRIILIAFLTIVLIGCATQPLKAPCNEQAAFCGTKTKINQW